MLSHTQHTLTNQSLLRTNNLSVLVMLSVVALYTLYQCPGWTNQSLSPTVWTTVLDNRSKRRPKDSTVHTVGNIINCLPFNIGSIATALHCYFNSIATVLKCWFNATSMLLQCWFKYVEVLVQCYFNST